MGFDEMFEIIKLLPFDQRKNVISSHGITLWVYRPSVVSRRFKNYDAKKNFQIWITDGTRKFKPNHLRVFIDLNLRVRSRPDLKNALLLAFDDIFYKKSIEESIKNIASQEFKHYLNPPKIIAYMSQLFIIEQLWGYHKKSKYNPPSLFYQGWVRQCLDDVKEIDNLIMSIARGNPPDRRYTFKENENDNKFSKNLKPLWYLS